MQLDGKNHSYLFSIFIRSKIKVCLKFIKKKLILGINFSITRPNTFFNFFFDYSVDSVENYNLSNNSDYHYLSLYLKLLNKLDINIVNKNHYLPFKNISKVSKFDESYFFIHIDNRWDLFDPSVIDSLKNKISSLALNNKIVLCSNIGGNYVFNKLKIKLNNISNIQIVHGPSIHDTISLIHSSHTCVSSHSGLVVHAGAAFKKKIIDLVPLNIFNELDRWIPFNITYKRYDINDFKDKIFEI